MYPPKMVQDDILEMMIANNKRPDMALLVDVEGAKYHRGKAMIKHNDEEKVVLSETLNLIGNGA